MPKETIAMNPPLDPEAAVSPAWSLTVGWSPEPGGGVQVGAGIAGDYEVGQYFHLERAQINNMIRALRKARDAAFGSDA